MTTLNWRQVDELHLHDAAIPQAGIELKNVRVAVDGAFLHIDVRTDRSDDEFTVHLVPASAVKVIRYQTTEGKAEFWSWNDL